MKLKIAITSILLASALASCKQEFLETAPTESTSTVERLNKIEQDINNLKQAFTSWTPTPQDGGAALKTVVASWSGSKLTETKVEDIESETIKQPN